MKTNNHYSPSTQSVEIILKNAIYQ